RRPLAPPAADLRDAEEHRQRGGQEGQRVEVERDVGRVDRARTGRLVQLVDDGGETGEEEAGQYRRNAVRGGQGELVGAFEACAGQQVGYRGVLGRPPRHLHRLDDERGRRRPEDD